MSFRRELAFPPEAVWSALTEPEQLEGWFMTKAIIDGRSGGSIDMVSGPSRFHATGRILAWEPPHIYEYEWNVAPREELPTGESSIVRWELQPIPGGTLLVVTHRRLTTGTAIGFAPGMHAFLDRLAAQLAGLSLPNWMSRYREVQSAYPAMPPRSEVDRALT